MKLDSNTKCILRDIYPTLAQPKTPTILTGVSWVFSDPYEDNPYQEDPYELDANN